MNECRFRVACGGGHTTAEHWLHVHEHTIQDACGTDTYTEIKAELDELARRRKADKLTYRVELCLGDAVWVEYETSHDPKDIRNACRHLRSTSQTYRVIEIISTERVVDLDAVGRL